MFGRQGFVERVCRLCKEEECSDAKGGGERGEKKTDLAVFHPLTTSSRACTGLILSSFASTWQFGHLRLIARCCLRQREQKVWEQVERRTGAAKRQLQMPHRNDRSRARKEGAVKSLGSSTGSSNASRVTRAFIAARGGFGEESGGGEVSVNAVREG